jgi:hypothetical protein
MNGPPAGDCGDRVTVLKHGPNTRLTAGKDRERP